MHLFQIDIYPEVPHLVAIRVHAKAANKEDAETIAKKIIVDLGLPAYPETMFERSWLKAL